MSFIAPQKVRWMCSIDITTHPNATSMGAIQQSIYTAKKTYIASSRSRRNTLRTVCVCVCGVFYCFKRCVNTIDVESCWWYFMPHIHILYRIITEGLGTVYIRHGNPSIDQLYLYIIWPQGDVMGSLSHKKNHNNWVLCFSIRALPDRITRMELIIWSCNILRNSIHTVSIHNIYEQSTWHALQTREYTHPSWSQFQIY